MARPPRFSALVPACLLLTPLAAESQGAPSAVDLELGVGVVFAHEALGAVYPIRPEQGYLDLGEIDHWGSLRIGARARPIWGGVRPVAAVDYAPPTDVYALWTPCSPGMACAQILLEPEVRVNRLTGVAGLEVPLPMPSGPISAHAQVLAGLRRYGIHWRTLGLHPGDTFVLNRGSRDETDMIWRVGGGTSTRLGPKLELWTRFTVDFSDLGPGTVPIQWGEEPEPNGVDLGRRGRREVSVALGLRRALF